MKLPAMIRIIPVIAGFLFEASSLASRNSETSSIKSERKLPAALASVFCERQVTSTDFAKYGLFDAQVDIVALRPKDPSKKITGIQAQKRARELASTNEQMGYASGLCPDGSGWAMAFPSPVGFAVENNQLKIPGAVSAMCLPGTLKALFAPEKQGRSLALKLEKSFVVEIPEKRGYAALTCVLKSNPKSGPRELVLFPLMSASSDPKELGRALLTRGSNNLPDWINSKRRSENLPNLELDQAMSEAASWLMARKEIRHSMTELQSVRANLLKKGIAALGEDRVRGKDLEEIVGLIWMSPAHRDLILSPSADVMGVALNKNTNGVFAVIIAGKKGSDGNTGAVARKTDQK